MSLRSRCYSELRRYHTFDERFEYLRMSGQVGHVTFGHDRWMNQRFYASSQWRRVRDEVILRDMGCDLGIPDHEVRFGLLVHHMNPMIVKDFEHERSWLLDPEFLICTSKKTHNAIHYGDRSLLPKPHVARAPGDTRLW